MVLSLLHVLQACICALPATMVWEVRRGASGSGGYSSADGGTDRSQQASPHISDPADWEIKGAVLNKVYSTTEDANIVAGLVDNTWLCSGDGGSGAFTAGTYHIVTVGSDGGGNFFTTDRNCASGNAADGNGVIGGAADIEDIDSKVVAGNIVHVEDDGTDYSPSGSINFTTAGTAALPIVIRGYNTTRNDYPNPEGGADVPMFDFGAGANYFQTAGFTDVQNIGVKTSGAVYAFYSGQTDVHLRQCYFENTNATANRYGAYISNNSYAFQCEFVCTNGRALRTGSIPHLHYCYFRDSNEALLSIVAGTSIMHCYFANIATDGVPWASVKDVVVAHNYFYDCADGITGAAGGTGLCYNNQFHDNVDGIDLAAECRILLDGNNYFSNSGNDVSNITKGPNATANDPGVVNAGGRDFSEVDDADAIVGELAVGE